MGKIRTRYFVALLSFICLIFLFSCGTAGTGNSDGNSNGGGTHDGNAKKPEWWGNKIGLSDTPPPPWTPVKVRENAVFITQREYRIGNNGLPLQIVTLGKEILTGPAIVQAVVNGNEVSWEFKPLKKIEQNPNEVTWEITGKGGPLTLTGTLRIEFDGFSLYNFEIASLKPVTIDSLVIEFPLKREFTLYARAGGAAPASGGLPPPRVRYASLYKNTFKSARKVDLAGLGKWVYNPGWIWPNTFFNEVWVGNDWSGFSIMCATNENIIGKKYAEFISAGKGMKLRINLISEETPLNKPLDYKYAYQATPVKPAPDDPKRWHASYAGYAGTGYSDADWLTPTLKKYVNHLYVGVQYHLLTYNSYPKLRDPFSTSKLVGRVHKYGAKIVPDFYVGYAAPETPEFKLYGPEWEVIPMGGFSSPKWGSAKLASPRSSSFSDFVLWTVKKLVEDFNLDGIYNDSGPTDDKNPAHGAGYIKNGERYPTLNLWATRELYKRIYTYLHTGGRDGVVFAHTMQGAALAGFEDVVTEGEYWSVEKKSQYTRLSPDMFRAMEMKNQDGTPYTWYGFFNIGWLANQYGLPRIPLHSLLMMTLVHHVLPTIVDSTDAQKIIPIWDLFDKWWTTSKFIPYWSPQPPVTTGSEEVLASTYMKQKEKRALVVVSNWKYEDAQAKVVLNFVRFDFSTRLKVTDALSGGTIPLKTWNSIQLNIPKRDFKLMIVSPE
jgi:hypothetical protein